MYVLQSLASTEHTVRMQDIRHGENGLEQQRGWLGRLTGNTYSTVELDAKISIMDAARYME